MQSQDNFNSQVGQGTNVPPYAFQQRPGSASATPTVLPPLTFHQRPLGSQAQAIRPAHPTFPRAPGSLSFIHTPPGAPRQGPIACVPSHAMNSGHSYFTHQPPPLLQGSTEASRSFPASELQHFPWRQSAPQISPTVHIPAPGSYLLPSLQRSAGPPLQPPSHHASRPPLPSYVSTSSSLMSDPLVTSTRPFSQHSYPHTIGSLPPPPFPQPPPPPPPPMPPSPPGVPPLPPSSPPNLSKNDGIRELKEDSPYDNDSISKDHPSTVKTAKDRNASSANIIFYSTEIVSVPEATDATFAHSPGDSDMDMEDDITQPDVEKSCISRNPNEERLSFPQDDVRIEHVQVSQHPGGHRPSEVALDGPKIPPSGNQPVTGDAISEFNDSVPTATGVNDLEVNAQLFSAQHANFSQLNPPVASADTIGGKLSDQLMEAESPFKLLQGYVTDDGSENDVKSPRVDIRHSNKHPPSKSMVVSFAPGKTEEFSDRNLKNQESTRVGTDLEDANIQKPNVRSNDAKSNIDEFGRLVREGVSDSDTSDSPRYTRRHGRRGRRQSRSQSRSRSPRDRRRRSPFRRKERRRRSRSLSPKRRRSRSKSPALRRGNEVDGDKLRRGKVQFPECFDFIRGKCYRGATCRYSHHESDKSEKLRNNRGRQQYHDTPPTLGNYNLHAERIPEKNSVLKNKVASDKELTLLEETHGVKEEKNNKELPVDSVAHFPDKLNYVQSSSPLVADVAARNLSIFSSPDMALGNENSLILEFPAQNLLVNPVVDQKSKQMDDSLTCESSPVKASGALSIHLPSDKREPAEDPVGNIWVGGSPKTKPHSIDEVPPLSRNLNDLSPFIATSPFQLPIPLPSVSQDTSSHFGRGIPQNHNMVSSTAPFLLKNDQNSPYQAPVSYQHSHMHEPPNSWSSSFVSPPQLRHTHLTLNVTSGDRSSLLDQHMQQSSLPPGNGFSSYGSIRTNPSELRTQSEIGQYQAYPSSQEPGQIPHKADRNRSSSSYASNLMSQQVERHRLGEDSAHSIPRMNFLQSVSESLPKSFPMHSPPRGTNAFIVGSLPSSSNPSGSLPYLQQNYYGMNSTSRVAPDSLERNHHGFVGPRISNNFNPYASTFDHPPSSRFATNALILENDTPFNSKHDPPLGLSSDHFYEHKIGSVNLPSIVSSSTSARLAQGFLSRPVGKQYDPLLDSIEPAPNSFGIADQQKHETTGDSYDIHRFKLEEGVVVSANYSPEIEEFGETADAEVGAVVNGSPGNPHVSAEMNAGEIEITQVKESGKHKKGKDSRSMKLFKVSIATFVKEVLKPSWRQGNMSKEAFKTIVKKTVDKVSSAMKSHKIPKSQAKINHYIDSSRGKLTKLIMGYVDKYVKT
ncbi:uncharacterized protein [Henckelia pumila]|uniref:uncharacterized protein isoform X2 n=1 Tax=Henckelia pumila TaxID=405737 RepID=UPI003C6E447C